MKWNTTAVMGHIIERVTTEADDIDTAQDLAYDHLEALGYETIAWDEVTTHSIEEPAMFRVQVMVGVDVIAHSAGEAMTLAIEKVRDLVGDDPTEPHPKEAWVTGIVPCDELHADTTSVDGYMVFRRPQS